MFFFSFVFWGRNAGGSAFAAQNWGQTQGADGFQIFCCLYFVCFLCFRAVPLEKEFAEARTEGRGKQQKKEKKPEEKKKSSCCCPLFFFCVFISVPRKNKKKEEKKEEKKKTLRRRRRTRRKKKGGRKRRNTQGEELEK